MKKMFFVFIFLFAFLATLIYPFESDAFTKIVDLVVGGQSVDLAQFLETQAAKKKKKAKSSRKKAASTPQIIEAKHADSKNIQYEINTSQVLAQSSNDIQLPVSNIAFINAVQEALQQFENLDIADIKFKPLKFSSRQPDSEDGVNLITFRATEPPPGVADTNAVFSIVNYARTSNVTFMNRLIMVAPGAILDTDVVFDPTNNPCLAFFITQGEFKIGGDPLTEVVMGEGGFDPEVALQNCKNKIASADLVDTAMRGIALSLGLSFSTIVSAAFSRTPVSMIRYSLTNDDKIGLANLYPNKENLADRGAVAGKVVLNKKSIIGAHVVIEDTLTGEPLAGTITSFDGSFEIKAIPEGTYIVYAEPFDGPVKSPDFTLNIFGSNPTLGFSTVVTPDPVSVTAGMTTRVKLEAKENPNVAFNINPQAISTDKVLTEKDYLNNASGIVNSPIIIMPGQVINDVRFWGDNINSFFGTLSVSGSGVTLSNIENKSIPISPYVLCTECEDDKTPGGKKCKRSSLCAPAEELVTQADEILGIEVDITCAPDALPGPRTLIFTADMLDTSHPSFGLVDQITGGLVVSE